ncbi:MAG: hypothetical protein OCC45_00650 [Desulfotalea sp.]
MMQNEYEYRVRGWAQLYTAGACLTFTGGLIFLALSKQDSFFGLILSQPLTDIAYWASAFFSATLAGYAIYKGQQQKKDDRKIVFKADSLSLPKTIMSQNFIKIPYTTIKSIEKFSPARSPITVILIKHEKAKTEISETGFSNRKTFNTVYEQLKEKTAGNTSP